MPRNYRLTRVGFSLITRTEQGGGPQTTCHLTTSSPEDSDEIDFGDAMQMKDEEYVSLLHHLAFSST